MKLFIQLTSETLNDKKIENQYKFAQNVLRDQELEAYHVKTSRFDRR